MLNHLLNYKKKHESMAELRLKHEGLDKDPCLRERGNKYYNNPKLYAMTTLSYFECFKCKNPYFGGRKECGGREDFQAEDLVCGKCAADKL